MDIETFLEKLPEEKREIYRKVFEADAVLFSTPVNDSCILSH